MDSINEQNTTVMNQLIQNLQNENNTLRNQIVPDVGDSHTNSRFIFIDQVDDNTFKVVYDQKKRNKQHFRTFTVLASGNVAKNSELKRFYIDQHRRTFNSSDLGQVVEIISTNQIH